MTHPISCIDRCVICFLTEPGGMGVQPWAPPAGTWPCQVQPTLVSFRYLSGCPPNAPELEGIFLVKNMITLRRHWQFGGLTVWETTAQRQGCPESQIINGAQGAPGRWLGVAPPFHVLMISSGFHKVRFTAGASCQVAVIGEERGSGQK